MIITSAPFFWRSFLIGEQSMNAGGLAQWPSKGVVLLGFVLLFFQGISELIKRIAVMLGLIPDPYGSSGGHLSAAEAEAARLLAELNAEKR
jgi:TRAP-type mannitol/chloroaromatic compound transport system permease small subunit